MPNLIKKSWTVSSVHLYSSSFWLEVLAVSNNPRIRISKDCKTVNQESFANYHLYLPMGPFNNYVDKMRGGGGQKCLFLSTLRV